MKKNLKPVPANQKGLKELPTSVRNNMGYLNKGGDSGKSSIQLEVDKMSENKMATILSNKDSFSKREVQIAKAKLQLIKITDSGPKSKPKRIPSFGQDKTTSLENMKNLGKNKEAYFEEKAKGGLTKPKMMYGGMANKKKHSYAGGGSVQDKLGVMIAVGKIKPRSKNGKSS
tara:strand:+ start:20 stop:535 length:516 start_codon:yes stop_codon:yes gene_type:complete